MSVGNCARWRARMVADFAFSACQYLSDVRILVVSFPLTASKMRQLGLVAATALIGFGAANPAHAQDNAGFYEIETKYIFGFTEGSGIGLEGEKEVSTETVARFGKRDGRYSASETKLEFETTPNQYIQLEMGPMIATHNISGVTGLDDRNEIAFSGVFGELRYLLLDRGPSSPLAVTLSVEPEWHRIDETGGARVENYGLETKINADLELLKNRAYLGFNLLYEPETTRTNMGGWSNESKLGVSTALAYRVTPEVTVGAETWYLRHYDGAGFNMFTGDAVFVGPTLYVRLARKLFMTAAWNVQVAGRDFTDIGTLNLNLSEFTRQRAKLKFAYEF
jgi:hypothetical protein